MRRGVRMLMWGAVTAAFLVARPNAAQGQTAVQESGTTSVSQVFGTKTVHVRIDTIGVSSGSDVFPKAEWLEDVKSVTLVQGLEISVDGKNLFVPRSVFADLLNPKRASIMFSNGNFILAISGADAAESYFVRVYFDTTKVKRRTSYSALTPDDKPTEDTRYRLSVLKDE